MRNYILLLIMVLALSGCGSGATSGDPLGTDTITVIASVYSLSSGQSSVITATVKHADGRAATGRSVTFSLSPNNSAGTLTVTNDGTNNGVATATYTAGTSTPASSVQDTVVASISNGAADAKVITRTGSATPPASAILTLGATLTTLSAGQSSTITANVTDSAGAPLSGVTVTFSLPVINSGVPTLSVPTAVTDGSGNAITIYSPGTGSPTTSIDDIVQASLFSGSTKLVTITRSGSATALANIISTLTASPATLSAGQNSIITATVTDTAGNPISGQTVKFSLSVTGSGVPTLIPTPIAPATTTDVTTDGSGIAIAIYSPGVGSPTDTVDDAIQAALTNGSSQAVIVTRSGQISTANTVSLTSSCGGIVVALNSCVVTATVKNASGSAVSGLTVSFDIAVKGTGAPTLLPLPVAPSLTTDVTTDGNGNANTIYTAGATAGKTDVVTATITGGGVAAVVIED